LFLLEVEGRLREKLRVVKDLNEVASFLLGSNLQKRLKLVEVVFTSEVILEVEARATGEAEGGGGSVL
jgi:hypothetical protein